MRKVQGQDQQNELTRGDQTASHRVEVSNTHSEVPTKVKIARLYPFLLLIKRLYMVLVIVWIPDTLFEVKIYSLMTVQLFHVFHAYMIKNFYSLKDHVTDVMNEVIYLILIFSLSRLTNYSKWNVKSTSIFVGIILSYSCFLAISNTITFIQILKSQVKACRNYTEKPNSEQNRVNHGEPYSNVQNNSDEDRSFDDINGQDTSSLEDTRNIEEHKMAQAEDSNGSQ